MYSDWKIYIYKGAINLLYLLNREYEEEDVLVREYIRIQTED